MIRREAYDAIQGFDENFELYFEDSDLCYRCRKAGWEIFFVAQAKVTHHLGHSSRGKGDWNATSLIYQQSHLTYYRKHASRFAIGLLKIYLLLKWLRLRYRSWTEKSGRHRSEPYVKAYLRIIFEREKVTLRQGIPR